MHRINVVLFDGFETLDAFGPVELLGRLSDQFALGFYSEAGGQVASTQGVKVATLPFSQMTGKYSLLIPGGMGTRTLAGDENFLRKLKEIAAKAEYILCVCTGSALLAQTGLLAGRRATSNKRAFEWVSSLDKSVAWQRRARWVVDGNIYTSSGVSAGMDMALGFAADRCGREVAEESALGAEYIWNSDRENDPFSLP